MHCSPNCIPTVFTKNIVFEINSTVTVNEKFISYILTSFSKNYREAGVIKIN